MRPLKWTSMSSQWLKAPRICARGRRVGRAQVAERLVGEHDAPAEGVVRPVALDDGDVVGRIALLHQQREVEPRRAAADAGYSHAPRPAPWSPLTLGEIV